MANIPIVKAEINRFIEEEKLYDEVLEIIDIINPTPETDAVDMEKKAINGEMKF